MTLNLSLLSAFLEEILGERETITIRDVRITELTRILDGNESIWHITQENVLWRKRDWLRSQAAIKAKRDAWAAENEQLESVKQSYLRLREAIAKELGAGVTDKSVQEVALKIFRTRNKALASAFGVSLDDVPVLDRPHLVMSDEDQRYFVL